tara:strand:+ start:2394 stop:2687 length:294 start_codon:yes stop_codon:yes gene_type:complete
MSDIFEETKRQMQLASAKEIRDMCDEVDVSYRWCRMVITGGIKNPGIKKIIVINEYQKKNSLSIHQQEDLFSGFDQQTETDKIVDDWNKTMNEKTGK